MKQSQVEPIRGPINSMVQKYIFLRVNALLPCIFEALMKVTKSRLICLVASLPENEQ